MGDFVSNAGDWASEVQTAFDGIETQIDDLVNDPSGAWEDIRASITGKFDDVLASLSAAAATNSDAAAAQSQIEAYQSQIDDIVAEASNAVEKNTDDKDGEGRAPAAFASVGIVVAGVVGGAALFMNL